MFVVVAADPGAARALAAEFTRGLLEYGTKAGGDGGITWIADRYLATIAGVTASDRFVTGVRGAPDCKAAGDALARLQAALRALPAPNPRPRAPRHRRRAPRTWVTLGQNQVKNGGDDEAGR